MGFFGAVGEAGGFSSEELLADHAVVGHVESVLEHAHGGGGFGVDDLSPFEGDVFEVGMGDDFVNHSHFIGFLCAVIEAEEEDFASTLLANHFGEVGGSVSTVKAGHVGVGLFEDGMFFGRNGEVTDDMEGVSTSDCPTRDDCHDDLWHKPNETLYL